MHFSWLLVPLIAACLPGDGSENETICGNIGSQFPGVSTGSRSNPVCARPPRTRPLTSPIRPSARAGSPGMGYYEANALKKSIGVRLTLVTAVGIPAARVQPRQDPCSAATFDEQACQAAVQNRGYCWNGKWVGLRYH